MGVGACDQRFWDDLELLGLAFFDRAAFNRVWTMSYELNVNFAVLG